MEPQGQFCPLRAPPPAGANLIVAKLKSSAAVHGTELMLEPPPTVKRLQNAFEYVGRILGVLLGKRAGPGEILSAEGRSEAITYHIDLHRKHYSKGKADLSRLGRKGDPPSLSAKLCRLLAREGSFGSVALLKGRPSFHTSPTSLSRSLGGVAANITPPRSPKPLPCCLLRNNRRLLNHLPGSPERMALRLTGVSLLFSP